MPRVSSSLDELPASTAQSLRALGENLAIARTRRGQTQREWSTRIGISIPTLIRLEQGDPRVAIGVYATALWIMNKDAELARVAAPETDLGALERELRPILEARSKKSAVRSKVSVNKRLNSRASG